MSPSETLGVSAETETVAVAVAAVTSPVRQVTSRTSSTAQSRRGIVLTISAFPTVNVGSEAALGHVIAAQSGNGGKWRKVEWPQGASWFRKFRPVRRRRSSMKAL
ncbi:hypothetical protein OHA21_15445 [Actinoplanes sp. NBC_00393]|uniref:hypothetical protein n=1 Tax=Actinoplanes sp. NBC_00393 TaxID=2975953 RepID=UPI002E233889